MLRSARNDPHTHTPTHPHTSGRAVLLLALALALQGIPAFADSTPDPPRVRLENAAPEAIAKELERALGAPVLIRGGAGRTVTLDLLAASPDATVARVAGALGGQWRLKLRVKPVPDADPAPSPVLEKRIAVGFQDVPARRAFQIIARELRADLEAEGDLEERVSVIANGIAASEILDLLAEKAGASWSLAYQIDAPALPPPPPPVTRREPPPAAPMPAPAPPAVMPAPKPEPPLPAPSGTELRASVRAAMVRLLRAAPDERDRAVRGFVKEMDALFASLARLSASERDTRLRTIYPVLPPWKRLYQGLVPEVQQQLTPALEVLERHLRL